MSRLTSRLSAARPASAGVAARIRQVPPALAGIVALAALLRFVGLGAQSFWYDEAATVYLLKPSLATTLEVVPSSDDSPPLYFLLAWLWTAVFGDGEFGIRSLSALLGTGTVLVVYLIGARAFSHRAGVAAGLLAAVNPMFVWYSQEARSYALLVFLSAVHLLLFLRVLEGADRRWVNAWRAVAICALLSHYFAAFLILAEAAVLLWRRREDVKPAVVAFLPIGIVGLLLVPVAQRQASDGQASWIHGEPIRERVEDVLGELLTNNSALVSASSPQPRAAWSLLALIAVLVGIWAAVRRVEEPHRPRRNDLAILGALALGIPWLLSGSASLDFFKDRNVMAAWLPLIVAFVAGVTSVRVPRLGPVVLGVIVLASAATTIKVAADPELQRANWRDAVAALGAPRADRLIVLKPSYARAPLLAYGHDVVRPPAGAQIREIVVLGNELGAGEPLPAAWSQAILVRRDSWPGIRMAVFRPRSPVTLTGELTSAFGQPMGVGVDAAAP